MERSRCSSCDFSFLSDRLTLDLHGFDEIGGRRSFERQSIANFSHDAFLQGLYEMDACVAASHFRSPQTDVGEFPRPTKPLTLPHEPCNHHPFISSTRR